MMALKIVSAGALIFAWVGATSIAAPITQSAGSAAETADQVSSLQTAARRHVRCNCSCQRGPVEAPDTVWPAWKFWRKARTMLRRSTQGLSKKL